MGCFVCGSASTAPVSVNTCSGIVVCSCCTRSALHRSIWAFAPVGVCRTVRACSCPYDSVMVCLTSVIAIDKVLAKDATWSRDVSGKLQALCCGRRPELNSVTSLCAAPSLESCRKLRDKELCSAAIDIQHQSVLVTNGLEEASIPQRLPPKTGWTRDHLICTRRRQDQPMKTTNLGRVICIRTPVHHCEVAADLR